MEEVQGRLTLSYLSRVLSVILHPVFMPLYGLLLIFNAPTFLVHLPYNIKRVIFLLAMVNMTVVPIAMLPLLRYRNLISTYSMESSRERVFPLTLGVLLYAVTTVIFYSYQIPVLIKSFMLAATVTSLILLVTTFWWKISIHSAGLGGLLATVMALSIRMGANLELLWIGLMLISALVMMSRLYLRVHSPAQVYTGFLAGFVTFLIIMVIF